MTIDLKLEDPIDDRSGWEAIQGQLSRRAIPIIVYSAFADDEMPAPLRGPLVLPVKKGSGGAFLDALRLALSAVVNLRSLAERLLRELDQLTLEAVNHLIPSGPAGALDAELLSALAVSRLVTVLANEPIAVTSASAGPGSDARLPFASRFVVPAVSLAGADASSLVSGDLITLKTENEAESLWVVLSPTCDTVFGGERKAKIADVLVARLIRSSNEAARWLGLASPDEARTRIKELRKHGNILILGAPATLFQTEALIVHPKLYLTIPYDALKKSMAEKGCRKIATLAFPYSEQIRQFVVGDVARVGTPEVKEFDIVNLNSW